MTLVQVPSVGLLSASDMSPARRESWIKLAAPSMDAMLVNPKLVETGLDLVMFSDLVFYEITTSLYVLWQSMRRVWRLGRTRTSGHLPGLSRHDGGGDPAPHGAEDEVCPAALRQGSAGVLVETDADDIQREIINAALEARHSAMPVRRCRS